MGTDAHAIVEIQTGDGWEPCFLPIWPQPNTGRESGRPLAENPEIQRRYGLFSLLADVTNRTGRMGVTTITQHVDGYGDVEVKYDMDNGGHAPIIPIDVPRGVPDDAWEGWREFTKQEPIHSATWLTLEELDDNHPMWDQPLYEDGIVIESQYIEYKRTGELPDQIAHDVGGPGLRIVTEEEYDAGERGEQQTAVHIHYQHQTLREEAGNAWWATLAAMRIVAPGHDKSKVRLLIAFDS